MTEIDNINKKIEIEEKTIEDLRDPSKFTDINIETSSNKKFLRKMVDKLIQRSQDNLNSLKQQLKDLEESKLIQYAPSLGDCQLNNELINQLEITNNLITQHKNDLLKQIKRGGTRKKQKTKQKRKTKGIRRKTRR